MTAVDRGGGLVRDAAGEGPFEVAGRLRHEAAGAADLPTVGDWVLARGGDGGGPAVVHAVLPRRTFLRRKRAGREVDLQMVAANVDTAFVVQSCDYDFNPRRFDRYLVMARDGGIEPVLVLGKTDLVEPEALAGMVAAVRAAGFADRVIALSNATGEGLEEIRGALVPGRTCCLLGSSGVGKTTLLNRLVGREAFETREVSGTGEGTHTTARRQLVLLDSGAMLVDTPGMRELGILASAGAVEEGFADLHDLAAGCRYADCTHTGEPGCAVLAAVADGTVSEERRQSYLKLRKEAAFHEASYAERRQKDKAFGKMVRSAMKHLKK